MSVADGVETCASSTAQHRELLDDALRTFELEPEIDLALMRDNQRLGKLFGRISSTLDGVLMEEKPDVVVVQGETPQCPLTRALQGTARLRGTAEPSRVRAGVWCPESAWASSIDES